MSELGDRSGDLLTPDPRDQLASPSDICLNCGRPLNGKYCSECGQHAAVSRLSIAGLLREIPRAFFDLNAILPRTVRIAVLRPHAVATAYIAGQRRTFLDPLRYYFIAVTANIAAGALLNEFVLDTRSTERGFWDESFVNLQIAAGYFVLLLPVALASKLLRPKLDLGLAEHYTFLLYIFGNAVLGVLTASVIVGVGFSQALVNDWDGIVFLGVFLAYAVFSGARFYRESSTWSFVRLAASLFFLLLLIGLAGFLLSLVGWP